MTSNTLKDLCLFCLSSLILLSLSKYSYTKAEIVSLRKSSLSENTVLIWQLIAEVFIFPLRWKSATHFRAFFQGQTGIKPRVCPPFLFWHQEEGDASCRVRQPVTCMGEQDPGARCLTNTPVHWRSSHKAEDLLNVDY